MNDIHRSNMSRAVIVLAVAVSFALCAWAGIKLTSGFDRVALLWFSNGIVVSSALHHYRDRVLWFGILGSGSVANLLLNFALGDPALAAIGISLANTLEYCIAAYALRGRLTASANLLQLGVVLRFFIVALIAAPAAASLVAACALNIATQIPILTVIRLWIPADALGMGIVVPLMLALRPLALASMVRCEPWTRLLVPCLLLLLVTLGVFGQTRYSLLFLLFPPILLVVFRLGFNGAALAISIVAVVAITATLQDRGPFVLVPNASITERVFAMQLFLGSLILTTYPICAVLATSERHLIDLRASQAVVNALHEHRQLAASSANVGFYTWDLPTNHLEWDAQLYRIFDIDTSTGPLTYEAWRLRIHPLDLQRVEHTLQAALATAEDVAMDFRIIRLDGTERDIRSRAVIERDARGTPRSLVGLSIDITELRRLDRMKSEFVSIVSHELRTPLTSIRGALGLLAGASPAPEKAAQLIQLANRNAERLSILIDDILDLEKIEAGKINFDLRNYRLAGLLEHSLQANSTYVARHQVKLRLRNDAPHAVVHVDANRLLQVMANLLSNAAKFSPAGSNIDVSMTEQHHTVRVAVRDYGPGIHPDFQGKVFGKFCQGDVSDARQKGGSGLGLAISKMLIEQMAGKISFITSADSGTTFFLDLPIAEVTGEPEFGQTLLPVQLG